MPAFWQALPYPDRGRRAGSGEYPIRSAGPRGLARRSQGAPKNLASETPAGRNALGVQPRDLISILQEIKAAGALRTEIMVM